MHMRKGDEIILPTKDETHLGSKVAALTHLSAMLSVAA